MVVDESGTMRELLTAAVMKLYDAIAGAEHGLTMNAAVILSKCNARNLKCRMHILRDEGLIVTAGRGKSIIWCTPERQAKLCAEIKARSRELRMARERARNRARQSDTPMSEKPLPVKQILRPAVGAPRPITTAARSVFELANHNTKTPQCPLSNP